ncbi:DUF4297 domain-containing protein [Streptococcus hillyeri]|uniref:DUF4297 domain-containing protein n=1 Tax=Streptococcus hillyeri TaxID=2282420 RepID=A0A3L9DT93_9STRE|nr:DUF4297 domain-containing protein [Streptococcus hillyeri]RLY03233.1 DUF4297 domain-containing protein [Streptococcus hillyeri]
MVADNGGAIAIKGMNYQNAVISLVAIRNFEKEGFELVLEADDDFEVLYNNYHAYIQVKGEKAVSLSKMINHKKDRMGKMKKSMLDKHFESGDSSSEYKFVVYDFTKSDLEKMTVEEDELFQQSLKLSAEQELIVNNSKVKRFSLIKTPFENDMGVAQNYLLGEMAKTGIAVDNRVGQVLGELTTIIYRKSEYVIKQDSDRKYKKLVSKELRDILLKVSSLEMFSNIIDNLPYSPLKKSKIKLEKSKISTQQMYEKQSVTKFIQTELVSELDELSEVELIAKCLKLDVLKELDDNMSIAIIISAYCDIIEEVSFGQFQY